MTLPKDVYPDSGNRLPLIRREDLSDQDKRVYDMVVGDSRSLVGLRGPGGIRLYSPRLTEYTRRPNEYLRYESGLGSRLSELAILVTARELDQQFEWTAHEPAALKAGLEQEIIDGVKYRRPVAGLGEKEAVIIQLGREAVGKRKVGADTFARALKLFGRETLVNLVSLMGYYAATAILLDTFDQHLPPDQKPLLPVP
ncbi:MAG: carboxymuconolactone decarboxylase family protein [Acidobacteria bacterium]|nr:carboxymuconolactone decarboxylase family protein [Acidobacteriota bacterium]